MNYRNEWLNIIRECNSFDYKSIKEAITELNSPTFHVRAGYLFQINPYFAVVLRRGRRPSIEIHRIDSDPSDRSRIYSSTYSPRRVLDELPTKIKEDITKKLQELKDMSRLIEFKKSLNINLKMAYDIENGLDDIEKHLRGEMTSIRPYEESEVLRFISKSIGEVFPGVSLPPDTPYNFFYNLIKTGRLKSFELNGRSYYKLR